MFAKKWFLFSSLGVALLAVLGIGAYFFFYAPPFDRVSFEVTPTLAAEGGILAESSFTLKSSKPVRIPVIKKYLSFEPDVAYSVKKLDSLGKEYEIKPETPLEEQKIITISIQGDQENKDDAQAWAYQVESPFQVLKTIPGGQGTSVPIETGIEFEFNRDLGVVDSSSVQITPAVSGKVEVRSKTLVFIPQQELVYRTLYTVTIKKGLLAGNGTEALKEDYAFSFETVEEPKSVQEDLAPYFSFDWKPLWEFAPDKEPLFTVQTKNISEIPLSLYRFAAPEKFISTYSSWRNPKYDWTRFHREEAIDLSFEQKILEFKATPQRQDPFTFIRVPQKLPEGFYVLSAQLPNETKPVYTFFQVSSLIGVSAQSSMTGIIWVKASESKLGAPNVSVSYNKKVLGATDQQGVLLYKMPKELLQPGAEEEVIEEKEVKEPFFLLTSGEKKLLLSTQEGLSRPDAWWTALTTDKPLYLPNDTIHVWGVMKRRDGTDIKNNEVTIQLRDGYGYGESEPVYAESKARISAYSTITGTLPFSSVRPGYYSLAIYLGKELILSKGITIATYTKPAYSLTLKPNKQAVFIGDEVEYAISADFFDTTPVSNLSLMLSIPNLPSREVKLDAQGKAVAKVKFGKEMLDNWSANHGMPDFITATVSPKNEEEGEISTSAAVIVFPARKNLSIEPAYKKEVTTYALTLNDIDLSKQYTQESLNIVDYLGKPTNNHTINVEVTKIEYKQRLIERRYDEYTKTTYPVYESDRVATKVLNKQLQTDAQGKISFEWKSEKNTSYEIEFSLRDERGIEISQTLSAYGGGWYSDEPSLGVTLENNNKDKTIYDIGEQFSVSMTFLNGGTVKEEKERFMFVRAVNGTLSYVFSDTAQYQDSFKEEFVPNVGLNGIWFSGEQFYTTSGWRGSLGFSYKNEERRLKVEVKADTAQYRPKDTVRVNVSVKDKNDKAKKGEVNIAVIDEALRTFGQQDDVLSSLYRDLYSDVSFRVSHENPLASMAEGGGCFSAGTRVKTPNGFTRIEDMKQGDVVVTRAHPYDSGVILAQVEKITGHYAYEHVVINDILSLTSNHNLLVNGVWKPAGLVRLGDIVITEYGEEKVHSVRTFSEWRKVYNIEITGAHTFFADGIYVHNQEKGGGGPPTRSDFKDLVLYKTVETDSNGQASVSFKVPDNLTSWLVSANAFTKDIFAGAGELSIPVRLPFFVDATLQKMYLTGDEVTLRLRTFGTAGITDDIEYTVESATLPFKKIVQKGSAQLEIGLGSVPRGDHSIKITAKKGEHGDALVRTIQVVDTYFMQPKSDFTQLTGANNQVMLTANPAGFVTMRFCSCTKDQYLSHIRSASWGSLRGDDEFASVIATHLLDIYFKEKDPEYQVPLLNSYQKESGGIALLPYGDPDLALSAHAAHVVKDQKEVMINEKLLEEYLLSSLTDGKADIHRIANALYGLSASKSPVLSKLQRIKDDQNLNLLDRLYVALALHTFGARNDAKNYYTSTIKPHFTDQSPYLFIQEGEKDPEANYQKTALAALLAYRLGNDDADKLNKYVFDQYARNRSLALEEMLILKEVLPHLDDQEGSFSYTTSKKKEDVKLKKYQPFNLALDEEEFKSLSVQNIKGLVSVVAQYDHETKSSLVTTDQNLKLERWYEVNGKPTTSFASGDLVRVYLKPTFGANAHEGGYEIIDYLPSGLRLISEPGRIAMSATDEPILETPSNKELSKGYLEYPFNEENQKITFAKWYYRNEGGLRDAWGSDGGNQPFYYVARVVSKGTYSADQALMQSTKSRESAALSTKSTITIK